MYRAMIKAPMASTTDMTRDMSISCFSVISGMKFFSQVMYKGLDRYQQVAVRSGHHD